MYTQSHTKSALDLTGNVQRRLFVQHSMMEVVVLVFVIAP